MEFNNYYCYWKLFLKKMILCTFINQYCTPIILFNSRGFSYPYITFWKVKGFTYNYNFTSFPKIARLSGWKTHTLAWHQMKQKISHMQQCATWRLLVQMFWRNLRVKATFSDSSVCDSVTVSAVCFFITVYLILCLFSSFSSLLCPLLNLFSGDDCVNWVNILLNIAFWALISDCHIMTVVK